jgi:hypothetical protein
VSGETQDSVSSWTVDTLHFHLTKLIDGRASIEDVAILQGLVAAADELTEAKFITHRVLVESQAEKGALALAASKEAIDKAETATSKAIDKAEAANDKRFSAVEELRRLISEQQRTFISRVEVDAAIGRVTERINELSARLDRAEHGR